MKTVLIPLALVWGTGAALAAQPLLTPQDLSPLLSNPQVRVIDIRDAQSHGVNHIPGAVNAPYGQWRGPASNPGELLAQDRFVALVQRLGLDAGTHAVVVSSGKDATDFGATARVYWTLKSLGLTELSIVNGGMQAWQAAGLPLSNAPVQVAPSSYAPTFDARWLATREQVLGHVQSGDALLLDARPQAFFLGETKVPAAKVAGTLPGAKAFDFNQWFEPGSSQLVQGEAARKVASQAPLPQDGAQDTVAFCNTGHWAATEWFALSEVAGAPNVKLYAGSMADWTQASEALPVANAPSRAQQLARSAQDWIKAAFK
ncbi:rhodanese-like domain-containing protein [Comamonas faecalis]|uniref:Rhodanese-like domain-containing protein n=1 Tax=Comamonas faecalis TaxID=1387849 RepID=A0ABP7RXN0_9BURK